MAKFTKPFCGCKAGDIHPTEFSAGDDCPKELEDAARASGALLATKAQKKAPETK